MKNITYILVILNMGYNHRIPRSCIHTTVTLRLLFNTQTTIHVHLDRPGSACCVYRKPHGLETVRNASISSTRKRHTRTEKGLLIHHRQSICCQQCTNHFQKYAYLGCQVEP